MRKMTTPHEEFCVDVYLLLTNLAVLVRRSTSR